MKSLLLIGLMALAGITSPALARPQTVNGQNNKVAVIGATPTPRPPTKQENDNVPPEKIQAYLKSQGSPLSAQDFEEVARGYHVKPQVLVAITKAETNLGKVSQRGSSCNVGSVGSYDSTNTTYRCGSHRQGIEMIAQTLNNNLLGSHTNVGQLSRVYNPAGHIYATGNNWPRNVLQSLAEQLGHPVPPTYQFRQ